GWEATVDGEAARIDTTDYLLRGVAVPAGAHRVEMRYRAPAARNGAGISACALLLLCGLTLYDRRVRRSINGSTESL
ncbi:MAG TPA: YfhO family protein, partial [Pyrinomonadaceae bacterium]|nr:YfhO family protein [Pyrinomonadaceae bacterium]